MACVPDLKQSTSSASPRDNTPETVYLTLKRASMPCIFLDSSNTEESEALGRAYVTRSVKVKWDVPIKDASTFYNVLSSKRPCSNSLPAELSVSLH